MCVLESSLSSEPVGSPTDEISSSRGAQLAQSVERVTVDLRIVSLSSALDVEITNKIFLKSALLCFPVNRLSMSLLKSLYFHCENKWNTIIEKNISVLRCTH